MSLGSPQAYGITDNISNRDNAVSRIGFFHLARLVFWRTGIIELSKLLSSKENDKYNVSKLLYSLSPDQYWGRLRIGLKTINKWNESLTLNEKIIKNIIQLRDKVYAHTDVKSLESEINNSPSGEELKQILELLKKVIAELYSNVFDTEIDFTLPLEISQEITLIFEEMEKIKKIRQEGIS